MTLLLLSMAPRPVVSRALQSCKLRRPPAVSMKSLSILASIIVALSSIALLLFRDHDRRHRDNPHASHRIATERLARNTPASTSPATIFPLHAEDTSTLVVDPAPDTPRDTPHRQSAMSIPRAIRKVFLAIEQSEGAGARVRRSIGTPQLRNFAVPHARPLQRQAGRRVP